MNSVSRTVLSQVYPVTVSYDQSLQKAIEAGVYDHASDEISEEHFPSVRSGQEIIEVILMQFDRYIQSDEVLREFRSRGLRAAEVRELLAFGATYPESQRDHPIVALGSISESYTYRGRHATMLSGGRASRWDPAHRQVMFPWIEHDWPPGYRFAAVPR